MYDLTDFESYQLYFKTLAELHKDLGAGAFLFGDDGAATNEGKVWKGKRLWLEPYQPVVITDQLSDNYLKEKKGSLWIGGSPANQKFDTRFSYFRACESIVEDIVSRMLQDRSNEKLITRLTTYKYGMGEFEFSATPLIGCRLDFTFNDPNGFEFDADKWN